MGQKLFPLIFLVDYIKDYNSTKFQPNCMVFTDLREDCTWQVFLYIYNDVITKNADVSKILHQEELFLFFLVDFMEDYNSAQ